jgi:hypothetical protein
MNAPRTWQEEADEREALARLAETRARPAARPAPPLSRAMHRALGAILKDAGPAPDTLAARWSEIVGPRLASLTEPVKVTPGRNGGTLLVRAPSAAAPMILHAADHILERVNLASGSKIRALKIVQTSAPAAQTRRAARAGRAITPAERAALQQRLTTIQSPTIRAALAELGEAVIASQPSR